MTISTSYVELFPLVRCGGLETSQLPRSSAERKKRGNQYRNFTLVYGSRTFLEL